LIQLQTQYGVPDTFINIMLQNIDKLQQLDQTTAPQLRKKATKLYFNKSHKVILSSSTQISYNPISSIQQQIMATPQSQYYSSQRFSDEDRKSELLTDLTNYFKDNTKHSIKVLFGDGFSKTRSRGGTMCNLFYFYFIFIFLLFIYFFFFGFSENVSFL